MVRERTAEGRSVSSVRVGLGNARVGSREAGEEVVQVHVGQYLGGYMANSLPSSCWKMSLSHPDPSPAYLKLSPNWTVQKKGTV